MTHSIRQRLILSIALLLLASCGMANLAPQPAPPRPIATLFPTVAHSPPPPTPPASAAPTPIDSGWQSGSPGVELRNLRIAATASNPASTLVIVRLDPAKVRLRVAYAPDKPRGLARWFADEHPLAVINGGFFTKENQPTALLISDGTISGTSYEGFGGMLGVAPDGGVSLQALRDQPYDAGTELSEAIQSFPMLVFPGGAPAAIEDNGERARRTAVALDHSGRLLLLISPNSSFTLLGLAKWLSQSDLDIDSALNFDGGSSTGLYISDGALDERIDSFGPLPIVLLVERR